MRGERNTDKNTRRFITISDMSLWEKIDEIMTLPKYGKSFNKVINDALFYGLEELHKLLFETIETLEADKTETKIIKRVDGVNEEYFMQIVRLLKEVILGETINKSILCSLFQAKSIQLKNQAISSKIFDEGGFRDIPDYLTQYELRALKDLRK